jgi:hypothetical protein
MNAAAFFQDVAKRNCEDFIRKPDDFRLFWNAMVSMNTVAEYLALHDFGYKDVSRKTLSEGANTIRELHNLTDLKFDAETFKHVRKIEDYRDKTFEMIATSTAILPNDSTTWSPSFDDPVKAIQDMVIKFDAIPALELQRPLPDKMLKIVASGEKKD